MAQAKLSFDVPVIVNEEACIKGCHLCVEVCPLDALAINPATGKAYMARDECWYCTRRGPCTPCPSSG